MGWVAERGKRGRGHFFGVGVGEWDWAWGGGLGKGCKRRRRRGERRGSERAPFLLAGSELGQAEDDGLGPLWPPAGFWG